MRKHSNSQSCLVLEFTKDRFIVRCLCSYIPGSVHRLLCDPPCECPLSLFALLLVPPVIQRIMASSQGNGKPQIPPEKGTNKRAAAAAAAGDIIASIAKRKRKEEETRQQLRMAAAHDAFTKATLWLTEAFEEARGASSLAAAEMLTARVTDVVSGICAQADGDDTVMADNQVRGQALITD